MKLGESDERASNDEGEKTVVPPVQLTGAPDAGASLVEIISCLGRLESRFESRFTYDATKEEAFRHVYADLQDAKLAQSLEATRPLLLDLLLFYDRIDTAVSASKAANEASVLGSFHEELLEILYRRDVRKVVSASDRYDRDTQQVVGVVETLVAEEHQQVERIVRPGFRWGARILRAEDVIIRRHRPIVFPPEA